MSAVVRRRAAVLRRDALMGIKTDRRDCLEVEAVNQSALRRCDERKGGEETDLRQWRGFLALSNGPVS